MLHFWQYFGQRLGALSVVMLVVFGDTAFGSVRYHFKSWNTGNGLPQNTVHSIVQTKDGYIWLGTFDGLARFDGLGFTIFRKSNTPELPTNRLGGLFVDPEGRLWIVTEDPRTIILYENGKFTAFENGKDFQTDDLTAPWRERTVMRMPAGEDEFVFSEGKFIRQKAAEERSFPKTFWDEQRNVWVEVGESFVGGADGKLSSYAKGTKLPFNDRKVWFRPDIDVGDSSWILMPFPDGAKLARIKDGQLTIYPVNTGDNSVLLSDRSNTLWIVGQFGGLIRIDSKTVAAADPLNFPCETVLAPDDRANADLRDIFLDRDGNLWICSASGLRLLTEDRPVTVYSTTDGLPSENIYSVIEDQNGKIWFGAWMDHLVGYENGKFSSEPFKLVTALFVDRESKLWVGSNDVSYRDGGIWNSVGRQLGLNGVNPGEINVISQDLNGDYWFGSSASGIMRFADGSSRTFTVADGLPGNAITSFLQTRNGTIWVGTSSGLARFQDDRFVSFTVADGLAGNFVRSLYEDNDGTLWVGTYDSGLSRYKDGKFATINSSNGLFSDGAFCILDDGNGWFWINSNQGIYRVRRGELDDFADGKIPVVNTISYGPKDGLTNVEGNGGKQPAGLKASDGRLWFPTAGGIAVIDPSRVSQPTVPPPVLIEDVIIDQTRVENLGQEIRLEPSQSAFDINYTAISFRDAENVKFRYRMEGLDENWTEAGTRRTAYFSHLPFGEYTFQVTAANQEGVWNPITSSIKVVVIPPFYRTNLFYVLVTLSVFGVVGFAFFYRLRELQARNAASAGFSRQLIDAQETERMRIALELHDSLGQSLAVIRNRALICLGTPEDHQRLLDQMQEISEASAIALKETREIAHNLHPAQLEHLGLAAALSTLVESVASGSDTIFNSKIDDVVASISGDEAINLYRIAQESISNIIKHSNAKRADIRLQLSGGQLVLTIEDDGRGMPSKTYRGTSLGIRGIRERVTMIGAELEVRSIFGKGTRLTVSLPLRDE